MAGAEGFPSGAPSFFTAAGFPTCPGDFFADADLASAAGVLAGFAFTGAFLSAAAFGASFLTGAFADPDLTDAAFV